MNDCILFHLDDGTVNTIHDIIGTVLRSKQGIEGRAFPLRRMFQTAVYIMQFFFECINTFQKIAQFDYLTVDFLKQFVKFLHIVFSFLSECIIGKSFT